MSEAPALRLFEGVGIELEYAIVDGDTLDVRPLADELLRAVGGGYEQEVELGDIAWSNELALHVIELKTNGPAPDLRGLGDRFGASLRQVDELLEQLDARVLPTAMHPWMDPDLELKLWPHAGDAVYKTFHRIFDCRGHGWANLQSMHVNLPFGDDREFGALHAACRAVLPLLPGLAASSPYRDGRATAWLDTRLEHYRTNADRVPAVAGLVVPEPVFTRAAYEGALLARIYADLEPLDPDGVLRHEWVNARGCIARFDRDAIEIRVLDLQECPAADIAVAGAVVAAVRWLVEERWSSQQMIRRLETARLAEHLQACIAGGDGAVIRDADYVELFAFPERGAVRARDLWQHVLETAVPGEPGCDEWRAAHDAYLARGCLARRIVDELGPQPTRRAMRDVYERLAECARHNRLFP